MQPLANYRSNICNWIPCAWTTKSTSHLDQLEQSIDQELMEQRKADATASTVTMSVAIFGALFALGFGSFIGYKTTNSIIDPLDKLRSVAREIGESGDLDHNIDIQRSDEIGELAITFSNMVAYLQGNAAGVGSDRARRPERGGASTVSARHFGQRIHAHGGWSEAAGKRSPRQRLAGFGRLQPGSQRFGRIRQSQRAGVFGD